MSCFKRIQREIEIPVINVIKDFVRSSQTMREEEVILNPSDKMVFESTFDNLMKQIRLVCSWKVVGEWLRRVS